MARAARWGLLAWSVIGVLILGVLFFRYVLSPIRIVFPPLVVALIVLYLLNPVVTALQKRGIRRVWGALLVYLVFLTAVGVGLAFLIPVLARQATDFAHGVPALLERAQQGIDKLAARLGIDIHAGLVQAFGTGSGPFNFVSRITSFTSGVVKAVVTLVLGPLIAFYLLVDLPKIGRSAQSLVPSSRRVEAVDLSRKVGETMGGFFRGQLVVAILIGLFSMLGFWIVGLPYFALIGFITALVSIVPLIGTVLAVIPVGFVALTAPAETGGLLHIRGGWPLAIACIVVLVIAQQLETRLLAPWLMKPAFRLHPITVLLSLLVGGALLGVWGMVLIVPIVAAIKVVVLHVWDTRSQWPPRPQEELAGATEGSSDGPGRTRGRRSRKARRAGAAPDELEASKPVEPEASKPVASGESLETVSN